MIEIIGTLSGETEPKIVLYASDNKAEIGSKIDEASRYYPELVFTIEP